MATWSGAWSMVRVQLDTFVVKRAKVGFSSCHLQSPFCRCTEVGHVVKYQLSNSKVGFPPVDCCLWASFQYVASTWTRSTFLSKSFPASVSATLCFGLPIFAPGHSDEG